MTVDCSPSVRVQLGIDMTELGDDARRAFADEVRRLLDQYRQRAGEGELTVLGWTRQTLAAAFDRMKWENAEIQAQVIRLALGNGGTVTRSQVYEVSGFPTTRTLRGFTRAPNRVVEAMRSDGTVPPDAKLLLWADYNYGPSATTFRAPAELAVLLDGAGG